MCRERSTKRTSNELLGEVDEPTAPFGLADVQGEGVGIVAAGRELDASLAGRVRACARALGVSAASVFHVAWAQVLARASGREDVVFGTVLFGRMHGGAGVERALGLFINTLPVRIHVGEVAAGVSVRETHVQLAQLLRHEHAPLALAQRCSGVAAPAPLFSALLNYRHGTSAEAHARLYGASGGVEYLGGEERTNYPLALSVNDLGEGFGLVAQVQAPLDPQRICGYMHTALEQLLSALEHAPERPLRELEVLPESERERMLVECNRTARAYPRESGIHELFEEQAARTPEAVAVEFEDGRMSYGELNACANRLAHYLRARGVAPGTLVGVCMERGCDLITSILGIFKAGAVYMPLDPGYPESRLSFMLKDSGVCTVLTQAHLALPWANLAGDLISIESVWGLVANYGVENLDLSQRSDSSAYLIYTSGSTGRPKGTLLEHRGLCNVSREQVRVFGVGPGSRVLQFSSPNFDASIFEIIMALTTGATLVLARKEALQPGSPLSRVLREERISHLTIPPSSLSVLEPELFPDLKVINVAGEACHADLVARWSGDREFYNLYGPTECTIWATASKCAADGAPPNIGKPIANTRVYVLDARGQPQPVGVAGELCIAGVGVGRGYLNCPELTAEKFIADPFDPTGQGRLYRTGDLVRWLPDGNIEFLGRIDEQVKVRGFRIELGEIESALRVNPDIGEVVVMAREDVPGDRRLVAYVVAEGGDVDLIERMREQLRASLPEYMMPSAFVLLAALPLTPNGKIDRKALPASERGSVVADYVAPRTPTEEIMAGIWAEVLKVERVGVHDNFFELGGHSLLATQVVSRVRQALRMDVSLRSLFAIATVAGLASELDEGTGSTVGLRITRRTGRDRPPISFSQQRLWFLDQLEPGSTAYNMPFPMRVRGKLDIEALQRSVDALVGRHEALRTTFASESGKPVQVIRPEARVLVEVEGVDSEQALQERLKALYAEPFDLVRGPLLRVQVLRLSGREQLVLLMMHHIVSDGWSMGVLFRELTALYAGYRKAEEVHLPELPVQYADYAVWQQQWLQGEELARQAGVLEGAADRGAAGVGVADGPAAARGAELPR